MLQVIEYLKKAKIFLKAIYTYIEMVTQGGRTISEQFPLIIHRRDTAKLQGWSCKI